MITFEINKSNSIGVFDSGVGGVGVLKEAVSILPHENFIYYGDSLNAPYGEKTPEQVFELSHNVVKHLLEREVKAVLIACNTATSASVSTLRNMYPEIPFIGMEPAIKMAVSEDKMNRVLVMATPMTLRLDKYKSLHSKLETKADFLSVECPGLAKRIESMNFEADDLKQMLNEFLSPYKGKVDNVVLGCTHYPFVKKQISEILGDVPLLDGGKGTALQLKRVLESSGLLNDSDAPGTITFESSNDTPEEYDIYRRLYDFYET